MNFKMMGRFIARIIAIEGVFLLPALAISLFCKEWDAVQGFLWTLAIIGVLSGILSLICKKNGRLFGAREGLICVGLSWIILSILGCLPFFISRQIPNFIDALFETVSALGTVGLTTGITPMLSLPATLAVILLMYFGRVGVLTISFGFLKRKPAGEAFKYANTDLLIG